MRGRDRGRLTRREVLRGAAATGAILTLPNLAAACGSAGSSQEEPSGVGGPSTDAEISSLTWALAETPQTLDVATSYNGAGLVAMRLGLEGLLTYDRDMKLAPLLAQSWSRPDPLRYVFKIRSGVTFWDGSPMAIDDVEFSIARHVDPKAGSQLSVHFGNVESVEQTGTDEITITMKKPDPLFEYVPTLTFVTPRGFSERLGKELGTAGSRVNTMGTGPFEITSFSTDEGITVKEHAGYWGHKPRVRAATVKYIGDAQTRMLAVRSGEVDGVAGNDFPLDQSEQWDRIEGVNTQYVRGSLFVCLAFPINAAPWDDPHVRRAIAHAADRAGYVRAFVAGRGEPALSLVAPSLWSGIAGRQQVSDIYGRIPQYDYDLDAARAELARSAHSKGFTTELAVPSTQPTFVKAMVSLSETLARLGITLRVNEVPFEEWLDAYSKAKDGRDPFFLWSGTTRFDPATVALDTFESSSAANIAGYSNATVDRLLRQQTATTDDGVRARALGEVLRLVGEDLPYLPLWWPNVAIALRDRYTFDGFNASGLGSGWLARVRERA